MKTTITKYIEFTFLGLVISALLVSSSVYFVQIITGDTISLSNSKYQEECVQSHTESQLKELRLKYQDGTSCITSISNNQCNSITNKSLDKIEVVTVSIKEVCDKYALVRYADKVKE